jgi:integrase
VSVTVQRNAPVLAKSIFLRHTWSRNGAQKSRLELPKSSHVPPIFPEGGTTVRLTTRSLTDIKLPAGKNEHVEYDDDIPGFGLRWRRGRGGKWGNPRGVYEYKIVSNGQRKGRRIQLGPVTSESFGTLKDNGGRVVKLGIRERVIELQAKVALGQDPAGDKEESRQRAVETFKPISGKFLAFQRDQVRPGSYRHIERHILKNAKPLHGLQLSAIDRRVRATLISSISESSGKVTANRVGSTLAHFFRWAMEQGYADYNPFIGITKFEETPRNRVLSDSELKLIWTHTGSDHYGSIVRLLMLTAQRADEIASLRWSEIDGDTITLPPERVKNKGGKNRDSHLVPLSEPAIAILMVQPRRVNSDGALRDLVFGVGERGFSGWSRCKERLDERIARESGNHLPDWHVHDIRRSAATKMAGLGTLPHVIEAVLNHQSGHKAGTAGIYNRNTYELEKRRALCLWADHVLTLVQGSQSDVVSLRAAS